MYEKLTPKEYILEEQSNDEALINQINKAETITSSADGAAAVAGCNKKGLFGGGFGGLGGIFNQIGIEELLIIGLLLLLIFEEGEMDMIIILAFLFLCGI